MPQGVETTRSVKAPLGFGVRSCRREDSMVLTSFASFFCRGSAASPHVTIDPSPRMAAKALREAASFLSRSGVDAQVYGS